jgi:hypothetical protein
MTARLFVVDDAAILVGPRIDAVQSPIPAI